jgi:hypothetical protein
MIIPKAYNSQNLHGYLRARFDLIKTHTTKENFLEALRAMGIKSRAAYQQIVRGNRKVPRGNLPLLEKTLDLTYLEKKAIDSLMIGLPLNPKPEFVTYEAGSADILSNPLHTLVLNLCGLNKKLNLKDVASLLKSLFSEEEVCASVDLLIKNELLKVEEDNTLTRTPRTFQFSTPPGVKLDYARNYLFESMELAKKNYDLPHSQREFTSFTARISKDDFSKLKDLIRAVREETYRLTPTGDADAVVHVNLNAFLISVSGTTVENKV